MSDEKIHVVDFSGDRLEITVEDILDKAKAAGLETVTILGWKSDDSFYLATNHARKSSCLWDTETAKLFLMEVPTQ